jgi:hypothetical protein
VADSTAAVAVASTVVAAVMAAVADTAAVVIANPAIGFNKKGSPASADGPFPFALLPIS